MTASFWVFDFQLSHVEQHGSSIRVEYDGEYRPPFPEERLFAFEVVRALHAMGALRVQGLEAAFARFDAMAQAEAPQPIELSGPLAERYVDLRLAEDAVREGTPARERGRWLFHKLQFNEGGPSMPPELVATEDELALRSQLSRRQLELSAQLEEAIGRVKNGATMLASTDGKPIAKAWLNAVGKDTVVMVARQTSRWRAR